MTQEIPDEVKRWMAKRRQARTVSTFQCGGVQAAFYQRTFIRPDRQIPRFVIKVRTA
jgi:hypothetical protein